MMVANEANKRQKVMDVLVIVNSAYMLLNNIQFAIDVCKDVMPKNSII